MLLVGILAGPVCEIRNGKKHVRKVNLNKLTIEVYANSSRARCAIYSRDSAIRIYSVSQLTNTNSFVKISSWTKVMGFVLLGIFSSRYSSRFSSVEVSDLLVIFF
jgi:hypothetical protein